MLRLEYRSLTASRCRVDVSESICRPHAVVKCATGKLVVRSNEERDFAPGLPSRDGPTSLVTPQGHRRCSRCPCAMKGPRALPLLGVDRARVNTCRRPVAERETRDEEFRWHPRSPTKSAKWVRGRILPQATMPTGPSVLDPREISTGTELMRGTDCIDSSLAWVYRVAASASHCQSHEFSQPQPPTQRTGSGAGCAAKNRERHVRAMLA